MSLNKNLSQNMQTLKSNLVFDFMNLSGHGEPVELSSATPELRALAAQLLLSEVLEYVEHGLNVEISFEGNVISEPNGLKYSARREKACDKLHMLDGLADVAYTMFWNSLRFNLPLEQAFEKVCKNNLEKFVPISQEFMISNDLSLDEVPKALWHLGSNIIWPEVVTRVKAIAISSGVFAVGFDHTGKVRKPSSYQPVDLSELCAPGCC